jgi:hypothetical protein
MTGAAIEGTTTSKNDTRSWRISFIDVSAGMAGVTARAGLSGKVVIVAAGRCRLLAKAEAVASEGVGGRRKSLTRPIVPESPPIRLLGGYLQ